VDLFGARPPRDAEQFVGIGIDLRVGLCEADHSNRVKDLWQTEEDEHPAYNRSNGSETQIEEHQSKLL